VPVEWLREYVDIDVPVSELARLLHMSGTEVDKIERLGDSWEGVWVGRIAALERHPDADKLFLATVEYGAGRTKTVVTGATNLAVGAIVPYAETGARVRDGHGDGTATMTLEPRKMRGILSEGMVLSAKELGLGADQSGAAHDQPLAAEHRLRDLRFPVLGVVLKRLPVLLGDRRDRGLDVRLLANTDRIGPPRGLEPGHDLVVPEPRVRAQQPGPARAGPCNARDQFFDEPQRATRSVRRPFPRTDVQHLAGP